MKNETFLHMKKRALLGLKIVLLVFVLAGCKEDFNGYYDPPKELEGPIYEQLASDEDFSEFVKAIDKLPLLKNAINSSGLYTIFPPTNEAMIDYLKSQGKSSIDEYDMSKNEDSLFISQLVNGHILFNMYFEYDFNELIEDEKIILLIVGGEIYSSDVYRFGSRFRKPDYWYFDKEVEYERRIRPDYKVLSVYTRKYIDKYQMEKDYEDLYGSSPGDFNVEEAQVLQDKRDISAKNGVIHGINKVLKPKPTMDEIIAEKNPYYYNLLEKFAYLGVEEILFKDTIFKKNYMGFDFAAEDNVGTIFCPLQGTFDEYVNENVLPKFSNNFDSVPDITAEYLLLSYMIGGRRWLSDVETGVINYLDDTVYNPTISEKIIASNGIVYLISDLLLSSAFTTVIKVPMLDNKFSWFLEMIDNSSSDFFNYLRYEDMDFTFLVPTNDALDNAGIERIIEHGKVKYYWNGLRMLSKQTDSLINYLIIPNNRIDPDNETYKWYQTRSGNFILFKNKLVNGEVILYDKEETANGYAYTLEQLPVQPKTTISGYLGSQEEDTVFRNIIRNWFWDLIPEEITTETNEETIEDLLKRSDAGNSFTLFMPTDSAIQAYKTDQGLGNYDSDSVWQDIAQYHVVKTRVYSEGSFQRKADNPLPSDSSRFLTVYKDIVYSPDNIFAKDNYAWLQYMDGQMKIENQAGIEANIVSKYDIETMNGVIHFIDKVLTPPVRQFPDND